MENKKVDTYTARRMESESIGIIPIVILVIIFFLMIGFVTYDELHYENKTYKLEEIDNGIYAKYYIVSTSDPMDNYEEVLVCIKDEIHRYTGKVEIKLINGNPYMNMKYYGNPYNNEITLCVPRGSLEIMEGIELRLE